MNRKVLTHEARAFLFRYKLAQGDSFEKIGVLFGINAAASKRIYDDFVWHQFLFDVNIPSYNANIVDDEMTQFLRTIKENQSPFVR